MFSFLQTEAKKKVEERDGQPMTEGTEKLKSVGEYRQRKEAKAPNDMQDGTSFSRGQRRRN